MGYFLKPLYEANLSLPELLAEAVMKFGMKYLCENNEKLRAEINMNGSCITVSDKYGNRETWTFTELSESVKLE